MIRAELGTNSPALEAWINARRPSAGCGNTVAADSAPIDQKA